MTCALTVWLAGSSIGAVATRSVVSGDDPPVDSAGIEGDGNEGSGVAARAVGQATALRRGRRGGRRRQACFRRTALSGRTARSRNLFGALGAYAFTSQRLLFLLETGNNPGNTAQSERETPERGQHVRLATLVGAPRPSYCTVPFVAPTTRRALGRNANSSAVRLNAPGRRFVRKMIVTPSGRSSVPVPVPISRLSERQARARAAQSCAP